MATKEQWKQNSMMLRQQIENIEKNTIEKRDLEPVLRRLDEMQQATERAEEENHEQYKKQMSIEIDSLKRMLERMSK